MKVVELKEELAERGEALSGNKAWLRRRLHAAIVSEYLETAPRAPPESRMSKIFARACCARRATFTISPRTGPLLLFCPKSTPGRAFSVLTQIGRTFRIPSSEYTCCKIRSATSPLKTKI